MNTLKRSLAYFIVLAMILVMIPVTASAATEYTFILSAEEEWAKYTGEYYIPKFALIGTDNYFISSWINFGNTGLFSDPDTPTLMPHYRDSICFTVTGEADVTVVAKAQFSTDDGQLELHSDNGYDEIQVISGIELKEYTFENLQPGCYYLGMDYESLMDYYPYSCPEIVTITVKETTDAPHYHSLEKTVVPKTCTTQGYDLISCSCGYSGTGNYVDPSHEIEVEVISQPSGCVDGEARYTCANCYYSEIKTIPGAHSYYRDRCIYCGHEPYYPLDPTVWDLPISEMTAEADNEMLSCNEDLDECGAFYSEGTVYKRTDADTGEVKYLDLPKDEGGTIWYFSCGVSDITLQASSTDAESTSAIALMDCFGNIMTTTTSDGIVEVTGDEPTVIQYKDLPYGDYYVASPTGEGYAERVRLHQFYVYEYTSPCGFATNPERIYEGGSYSMDGRGTYYNYFAEADGTITISIDVADANRWYYYIENVTAGEVCSGYSNLDPYDVYLKSVQVSEGDIVEFYVVNATYWDPEYADGHGGVNFTIVLHEHDYNTQVTVAPTCTEEGSAIIRCGSGGCTYKSTETVAALGHSYTDGICTRCGAADPDYVAAEKRVEVAGANVVLGNDLTMSFFINKDTVAKTDYVEIVRYYGDGRAPVTTTLAYDELVSYYDYLQVSLEGLAAKEMTDQIEVTVRNAEGKPVSKTWTDSLRDYCVRQLNNPDMADSYTLLVDMLNYGAAAQGYFNYNIDDLANSTLTAEQQANATQDFNLNDCSNNWVVGQNFVGSSLSLETNIVLTMYFNQVASTNGLTAIVTYTDHLGVDQTLEIAEADFITVGNLYGVAVETLVTADVCQLVTLEVYDGDTLVANGADSMESYAVRQNDELITEMLKFPLSAYAYLHGDEA